MKAIIAGGGKVGYYIFKTLRNKKYDVVLIERDRSICDKISEELDGEIICGDASQFDVLKDAGIEDAEIIAAVTGKDEENLVICQMAKIDFNVNKTIARINNPKNRPIFKKLGVDRMVCSTEVIANLVEDEFDNQEIRIIQNLARGEMILLEIDVNHNSKWRDKTISSLELPKDSVIASVLREDGVVYPRGSVEIKENDKVLMVTSIEGKKILEDLYKR